MRENLVFMPPLQPASLYKNSLSELVHGAYAAAEQFLNGCEDSFFLSDPETSSTSPPGFFDYYHLNKTYFDIHVDSKLIKRTDEQIRDIPEWSDFLEHRLQELFNKLTHSNKDAKESPYFWVGDARLSEYSLRKIMQMTNSNDTNAIWLDDEVINAVSSFAGPLSWDTRVAVLNSQLLPLTDEIISGSKRYKEKSEDFRRKILHRLANSSSSLRCGQRATISNATVVVAPTLGSSNHWICLVADKQTRTITLLNSLKKSSAPHAASLAKAFSTLLRALESPPRCPEPYIYKGAMKCFPKQKNDYDCGLYVALSIYSISSGRRPAIDDVSLSKWRKHLALLMLELQQNDIPSKA